MRKFLKKIPDNFQLKWKKARNSFCVLHIKQELVVENRKRFTIPRIQSTIDVAIYFFQVALSIYKHRAQYAVLLLSEKSVVK